jgi:hypothetical protein
MGKGKSISQLEGERELVVKARTWFYLFKSVLPFNLTLASER